MPGGAGGTPDTSDWARASTVGELHGNGSRAITIGLESDLCVIPLPLFSGGVGSVSLTSDWRARPAALRGLPAPGRVCN